jgi:N-acetylglucosamine-6-phosphate deacetylase
MKIEGLYYLDGMPVSIEIDAGFVKSIKRIDSTESDFYIAPGFIDNQINGCVGVDFSVSSLTVKDVIKATRALWRTGITTYMPTIITSSPDIILRNCAMIAEAAQDKEISGSIAGIHLEGPYISPEDGFRGAHNLQWVRRPDWDELQRVNEAANGLVNEVTLAPEWEGACEFIEKCILNGITVALGHHDANAKQIRCAVDAGAKISTHLGNGLANKIHRHENPLWPQLADDRLMISLIGDGFHLLPEELKVFYRVKGRENIILTSDITLLSGMPPGIYEWDGVKVELSPQGLITMPSQNVLAGASLPLSVGVGNMMRFADCTLAEAVHMAGRNQARLFGFDDRGELAPGKRADIVLFRLSDREIKIKQTIFDGRIVQSEQRM